jgi:hypothetical protein
MMAQFMLTDFLNNPAEYAQAETIWRERWESLLKDLDEQEGWKAPWVNTSSNDGTPFRDGNPIFSAISPSRRLGVRVIQVEPGDDPNELNAWTDVFGEGEPDAINELVVHCVLSEATLGKAAELIKKWITDQATGQSRRAS